MGSQRWYDPQTWGFETNCANSIQLPHCIWIIYIYIYINSSLKVIILQCSDRWPLSPAINHVTCGCQQATGIQLKKCGKLIGKVVAGRDYRIAGGVSPHPETAGRLEQALGCEQSYQLGPWKDMGRWRNTVMTPTESHGYGDVWIRVDEKVTANHQWHSWEICVLFHVGIWNMFFCPLQQPHCTLGRCL